MKPIIVGVDGSEDALKAVDWAAREASLRQRPLGIVHCWFVVDAVRYPVISDPEVFRGWQHESNHKLNEAVARANAVAPDVQVERIFRAELPPAGLLAAAENAELVVVGASGVGAFAQLFLGSISRAVAARATIPVVVVRGEPSEHRRIVVGADGKRLSTAALDFAFEEASWHSATLAVVHACSFRHNETDVLDRARDLIETIEEDDRLAVLESLAGRREQYPDVKVEEVFVHGPATKTLLEQAASADLVVVGSQHRSAATGLLLGSVAQAVLRNAESPVAVVHG